LTGFSKNESELIGTYFSFIDLLVTS
jgi:hypothetical protein